MKQKRFKRCGKKVNVEGVHTCCSPSADGQALPVSAGSAPFLPDDVVRCNGVGDDTEGWREGCETCLRRTAKRGSRVVMMSPPAIIAFECEYLIELNTPDYNTP